MRFPSAQPKSGQWVKHDTYYDCSRCNCIAPGTETATSFIWILSKFCPACGAKMQNTGKAIQPLTVQFVKQWIPCSERLPKKSGQYYVSGGGKVWICEFLIIPNFTGGWCNNALDPIVQAWMPLPTPYKGGQEE